MSSSFRNVLATASATALLAACASPPANAPAPDASARPLTLFASFAHQVTGVAVADDGRVFVSFPRWTEDTATSVAESEGGALVQYPNAEWNTWRNARKDEVSAADHWVCVQAIVADHRGNLWVVDAAAPAMAAVVKRGPKLVRIDLSTNKVAQVIAFDETVAPQGSYMNDVRISPDGRTAYLTDSGARGALVVVDIASGRARRVLDGHPSTQPDPSVTVMYDGRPLRRPDGRGVEFAADGIALSRDGSTLYWQAIKGTTLYSIPTAALLAGGDPSASIAIVGNNGPADGLMIGRDGLMYVTSPQDDSVKTRDLSGRQSGLTTIVRDRRLRWPDTFAEGTDGEIYVTTSHIQDSAFFDPTAPAALPTQLWRIGPAPSR